MTYTTLTQTELAHAYTPDAADDAPVVDGNGNPRDLTEGDLTPAAPFFSEVVEEINAYNEELWLFEQEREWLARERHAEWWA